MCGNESIFNFEQNNICNMNENDPKYSQVEANAKKENVTTRQPP
jgi:hypothetical protein